MKLKIRVHFGC